MPQAEQYPLNIKLSRRDFLRALLIASLCGVVGNAVGPVLYDKNARVMSEVGFHVWRERSVLPVSEAFSIDSVPVLFPSPLERFHTFELNQWQKDFCFELAQVGAQLHRVWDEAPLNTRLASLSLFVTQMGHPIDEYTYARIFVWTQVGVKMHGAIMISGNALYEGFFNKTFSRLTDMNHLHGLYSLFMHEVHHFYPPKDRPWALNDHPFHGRFIDEKEIQEKLGLPDIDNVLKPEWIYPGEGHAIHEDEYTGRL